MQEPIIFNYSILENILYGKSDATNTEILENAKISNVLEFVEKDDTAVDYEDAQALVHAFELHKAELIEVIGEAKYDEELAVLKLVEVQEQKKGKFQALAGDVDVRAENLKDISLSAGFEAVQCGIKGCKLSGGQKQRVAIARTIIR
jgi:ABC-type multidrug transport system fused ATPase/permease subunit